MSRAFWWGAILCVCPIALSAQATTGVNPAYKRAQTLVNEGNTAAGRALVDSMIAIAAPGSNEYAEGVYWRAVLASTAAEAEMDYRRIVVDYPQSPRVEDALIRLAQLEIARANYDGALRHLNRLVAEHPQSPARGRAGYWMARALFDKNDIQGGCAATSDALARTSEDDAELRNQITYLNQRCAGLAAQAVQAPQPAPAALPVATPMRDTSVTPSAVTPAPATVDSVKATVSTPPAATTRPVQKPPLTPPEKPRDAAPTMVETQPNLSAEETPASSGKRVFSVQVAAYNVKSQADAMVTKLKKSGYQARVDGTKAPYRVRIGKYPTQAQASAVQRSLKAKQITGFVVQAETQ